MGLFGGFSSKGEIELDRDFEEAVREGGKRFLDNLFSSAESEVKEKVTERIEGESTEEVSKDIQNLQSEINSETSFGFTVPEVALLWFNVESNIAESELGKAKEVHESQTDLSISQVEKSKRAAIYTQELSDECLEILNEYNLEERNWSHRPEHLALGIQDFEDEGALAKHRNEKEAVKNIEKKVSSFVENRKRKLKSFKQKAEEIEKHSEHAENEARASKNVGDGDHTKKNSSYTSPKEYRRNNPGLDHY